MTRLAYEMNRDGTIEIYDVANRERNCLIQTDWDWPGTATSWGWQPCHDSTDGTVNCPECGKTNSELIASAYDFLGEHEGEEIELSDYDSILVDYGEKEDELEGP